MENTPRSKASQESPYENDLCARFRGVPLELLCNMEEIQRMLNLSDEAFASLKQAGMPVLLKAGRASIGWTTDVIQWARSKPKLPIMAAAIRKTRERRKKPK